MGRGVAGTPALDAETATPMTVLQVLHRLLTRQRKSTTIYECRYCGTTVDSQTDPCPYYGPIEVVEYELT